MIAKQILFKWLAEDDLQKTFQGLFFLANKYKDEQLQNNATFQSGRLKALEKHKINGTLSHEEDHLQSAKIRQALLQIIQGLPDNWILVGMKDAPVSLAASSKINWKKYAAYVAALVALLAGIAELTEHSVRDIFQKKDTTEIPAETHPTAPNASTTGDNSPAVITNDGDVDINYGEPKPKKDSTGTKQTLQK